MALAVSSAFPNPSRTGVNFRLELPRPASVEVAVFDLQGRMVWTERRSYGAGRWTVGWSGIARGERAGRGVYLMRLTTGGTRFTRTALRGHRQRIAQRHHQRIAQR